MNNNFLFLLDVTLFKNKLKKKWNLDDNWTKPINNKLRLS